MRKAYNVNGEIFTTKKDLQNKIRSVLYAYPNKSTLNADDFIFIRSILDLHPSKNQKIGVGVQYIYIKQNPIYKSQRGFWIVRIDGSETDFSYLECLRESTKKQDIASAFRVAIEPYIVAFRNDFFDKINSKTTLCPITGEKISIKSCHIDHATPNTFQKILHDFIHAHNIDVDNIRLYGKGVDNAVQLKIIDDELEARWINYHNLHAHLRVVSKKANLSILRKMTLSEKIA